MSGYMPPAQRDDWETPQALFDVLHERHRFTLDAAASASNAKLAHYYTEQEDGLTASWTGERVFVNPPYGRALPAWIYKCHAEHAEHGVFVCALLPARTDTRAFHRWIYGQPDVSITFLPGRLRFELGGGQHKRLPRSRQCWHFGTHHQTTRRKASGVTYEH